MKRGELYRVRRPQGDPKPARTFVIVSRQPLIDSMFSTVVCAPVFSERHGLPTQVPVGQAEGLKHDSAVQCDGLMSIEKTRLSDYVGELSTTKLRELEAALASAFGLARA
ncbi:MAG: type II toxin-antitoxin system PemK/MazF family toxin [Alphaproteobacteria bacterium]|nr:type II toxin-antitoxin system PemK/MazF family toxin [Alphaproteobacteria bacterium]